MDRFTTLLNEQFGATLAEDFINRASYYSQMDVLEYISKDTTTISDRVDEFLTLFLDADNRNVIGFRLKGFGYVFNNYVKRLMKLKDEDFNPIVNALECGFSKIGAQMFPDVDEEDERRVQAYRSTKRMIKEEEVELPVDFLQAA